MCMRCERNSSLRNQHSHRLGRVSPRSYPIHFEELNLPPTWKTAFNGSKQWKEITDFHLKNISFSIRRERLGLSLAKNKDSLIACLLELDSRKQTLSSEEIKILNEFTDKKTAKTKEVIMDLSIKEFFGQRVKFMSGSNEKKGKVVAIYHDDYKRGENHFRIYSDAGTEYYKNKDEVTLIPVIKLFAYQAAKNQVQWFSVLLSKATVKSLKLTRAPKLDKEIEA